MLEKMHRNMLRAIASSTASLISACFRCPFCNRSPGKGLSDSHPPAGKSSGNVDLRLRRFFLNIHINEGLLQERISRCTPRRTSSRESCAESCQDLSIKKSISVFTKVNGDLKRVVISFRLPISFGVKPRRAYACEVKSVRAREWTFVCFSNFAQFISGVVEMRRMSGFPRAKDTITSPGSVLPRLYIVQSISSDIGLGDAKSSSTYQNTSSGALPNR